MRVTDPTAGLPRRELEHSEVERAFGLVFLTVTVWRSGGVRKDGSVRHLRLTTKYRVETPTDAAGLPLAGRLNLVKEDGEVYEVTDRGWCSCQDHRFEGRRRTCKHFEGCLEHDLFPAAPGPDDVEIHF